MAVYTEVSDEELATSSPATAWASCCPSRASPRASRTPTTSSTPRAGTFILTLYEKRVAARATCRSSSGSWSTWPRAASRARRRCATRGPQPERACRPPRRARHVPRRPLGAPADGRPLRRRRPRAGRAASRRRGLSPCAAPTPWASPAGGRSIERFADTAPTRSRRGSTRSSRTSCGRSKPPGRNGLARGRHPRRPLPRQRLLPRRTLSGLIDFYFACNDALAYDIAVCLNAWCFEKDLSFNITKGRALLRGYEERAAAHARRSARRCRCWRAARRCASC